MRKLGASKMLSSKLRTSSASRDTPGYRGFGSLEMIGVKSTVSNANYCELHKELVPAGPKHLTCQTHYADDSSLSAL